MAIHQHPRAVGSGPRNSPEPRTAPRSVENVPIPNASAIEEVSPVPSRVLAGLIAIVILGIVLLLLRL
jgi:hypothetical protein